MRTIIYAVLVAIGFAPPIIAQHPSFLHPEGRLLFPALLAHHVEARMGAVKLNGEDRLRLDIGNSVDVWDFSNEDGTTLAAVGADFFTWTSLRQDQDFHFPVDAVDYLFGINASLRTVVDDDMVAGARLRLSHISAHLADGSYDKTNGVWRDERQPIVYSREFLDLIAALEYRDLLRVYAGGQFIYHVDPSELGSLGAQAGVEIFYPEAFTQHIHLYIAYDFRTVDTHAVTAAHSMQLGVKIGSRRGRGVNLFLVAYHGKSQHGEFHDVLWSYWGPGVTVDF